MLTCSLRTLLKAIRQQEVGVASEQDSKKINEKEKALGPLQIRPAYHNDAEVRFSWADVYRWRKAVKTFLCYMLRYAYNDLMLLQVPIGVCEKFARIHNGGPRACLDNKHLSATDLYWECVKMNIEKLEKENGYNKEEKEE
jgi:hypothetical protein